MATYKKQLRDKDNNIIYPAQGLGTITGDNIDWSSLDQSMATSASSTDYIVLGDLLICFGKETSNNSSTPKSVTFPKTYAYTPKVFASPLFQESSASAWSAWPATVSTTGATFQCKYVSPDATAWGSWPFFWFAIGKIATS